MTSITPEVIKKVRAIEARVYPIFMRGLEDVETLQDLAEYCECSTKQVSLEVGDNWYLLVAEFRRRVEIVDLACVGRIGMREVFRLSSLISTRYAGKLVELDARESTSYPLILKISTRNGWKILKDEPWEWGPETMHDMVIQIP